MPLLGALLALGACDDSPATSDSDAGITGGSDAATGPILAGDDPCMGVPEEGRCAADGQLEYCSVPTDVDEDESAPVEVVRTACDMGERCAVNDGYAECVPQGECRTGDTSCAADGALRRCTDGRWASEPCATECIDTGLGAASCAPSAAAGNRRTLRVTFDAREPNEGRTDWATETVTRNAEGFQVVVFRGMERLDEGRTGTGDQAGRVEIALPSEALDDVRVVVSAIQDDGAQAIALALADPNVGAMRLTPGFAPREPRLWSWEFRASAIQGDALHIAERDGAGAANVYNVLHRAWREVRRRYTTRRPLSVLAWAGEGTTYTCGACFNTRPVDAFDASFRSQVWMPIGGTDHQEWSDAVVGHEVGHWVMASFGRSPGEGGSHSIGVPTMPGQAWSEGFATWFSYELLRWPAYVDRQGGSMFWADIANRSYHRMRTWQRPSAEATGGLTQRHDENDVAATLRTLAADDAAPLFTALASTRMRTAPFARGYNRHTWERGLRNIRRTSTSAPFLGDMLDALNCASFPRDAIDRATVPDTHYPYPSDMPLCGAGGS